MAPDASGRRVHETSTAWTLRGRSGTTLVVMATPRALEQSFVIRINTTPGSAAPDALRGTVVHVATGERRYITSYGDLCSFIDARRAPPPAKPSDQGSNGSV